MQTLKCKYTICFIKRGDRILLLNRETPAWMGRWNGVGGKIEDDETPLECIEREIEEETGIILINPKAQEKHSPLCVQSKAIYKGKVTWEEKNEGYTGGMYAFLVEVPETFNYETPIQTEEGILDWKSLDWIFHPKNRGIANLKYFLLTLLNDQQVYQHHFIYDRDLVEDFQSIVLNTPMLATEK